jgi:hypothetical protein
MSIPQSGQLVLELFNQLVEMVKPPKPVKLDKSALSPGMVYSQRTSGLMIDPADFANPWTPAAGTAGEPQIPGARVSIPSTDAAFKFAQLVDSLLKVTADNSYDEYSPAKQVSVTYKSIIDAMTPLAAPPLPANVQAELDKAQNLLYKVDPDSGILMQSRAWKNYQANSQAYATALEKYSKAQDQALSDPVTANSWPVDSRLYQEAVDQSYATMKAEGAEVIENALAVTQSIGISIQQSMIANSKEILDKWSVGLTGIVAVSTPYSYASPSNWSDPDADDDGWTRLTIDQSSNSTATDTSSSSWSGGVSGFFGFFDHAGVSAGGSTSSSSFANDASGISIDLEYGIVTINRPWFMGDVFYLTNWYLTENKKNSISTGTLDGQDKSLLPMIPVQFLCIRNLKITATDWHSDGHSLTSQFSGGGGFSLGFISFGASYSTAKTHSDFGWSFDGATLSMHGVQIVAFMSEVLPPCAPLDDPGLVSDGNSL